MMLSLAPMRARARALLILAVITTAGTLCGSVLSDDATVRPPTPTSFVWFEIWIDTGGLPLSAWQAELTLLTPGGLIAGVEGGDSPASSEPPHYDPRALRAERAVLAAFSTAEESSLPRGRCRVATIHAEIPAGAEPVAAFVLEAAAGPDGVEFEVTASIIPGK